RAYFRVTVLATARFRVVRLMLLLIDRDDLPAVVEDHEARAGRSLVNRCCVLRHPLHLLFALVAGPSVRGGLDQHVGRRRAGILMAGASLAEVARASLLGDKWGS